VALNQLIPWEMFRAQLRSGLEETGQRATPEARKSPAGRKPWDEVLMFKVLVLQSLYNLADDSVEYLIRDRLSFMRFLGLGLQDRVPDAKTVWLYREALAKTGLIEVLFADFDSHLKQNGYLAMGGQIIDATIIPVPKNRNSREENEAIKAGEMPKDWENNPAKLRQKDRDARWTKKHGRSHYGYKNHISIDRRHKLVRRYTVTNAARHDSQEFDTVLDDTNTCRDVWADSAYRSAETEEKLTEKHFRSRVHRRAKRNHGLSEREHKSNQTRSKVRARVRPGHHNRKAKRSLIVMACHPVRSGSGENARQKTGFLEVPLTLSALKSHHVIAGMMTLSVTAHSAAVAARPSRVR
jgi:transposase, IS5 family